MADSITQAIASKWILDMMDLRVIRGCVVGIRPTARSAGTLFIGLTDNGYHKAYAYASLNEAWHALHNLHDVHTPPGSWQPYEPSPWYSPNNTFMDSL
jgi:hypothetical protein